jgi:cellobiose phosphorylase
VKRKFRGAQYNIELKNPNGKMKGVSKVLLNGVEISGNIIPLFDAGNVVNVEVII